MTECPDARTQDQQQEISPKEAIKMLEAGNKRFVDGTPTFYCYDKMAEQTAKNGQFPFAAVLACVDSRIPVEQVFDQAIGDMFVARVAGNFINTDIVGSIEFAVASGVKAILILGHTSCGAIKGACDGPTALPALNSLLSNLESSVKSAVISTGKEATSKDPEFVQAVADVNVEIAMMHLRNQSALIDSAIENGELALAWGMYDLKTRVAKIKANFNKNT